MQRQVRFSTAIFSFMFLFLSPIFAGAMINKTYVARHFDQIVADGYYDLSISKNNNQNAVVKTTSYPNNPIKIFVQKHTLFITSAYSGQRNGQYIAKYPHPMVNIQLANKIQALTVYGPVNVIAKSIASSGFHLRSQGYGHVNLQDVGNISFIKQTENNILKVSGIASEQLSVYSTGFGVAKLQGTTKQFYVRLNQESTVKARGLAANYVAVQAKYHSQAYVYPLQTLRAFTDQSGEIYYYKHLADLARYSIQSGNIFEMKY